MADPNLNLPGFSPAGVPSGNQSQEFPKVAIDRTSVIYCAVLCVGIALTYWFTIETWVDRWDEPQYSHGWLIPLFSLAVLFYRLETFPVGGVSLNWWGIPVIGLGIAQRLFGITQNYDYLDGTSLVVVVAGSVLLLWGHRVLIWAAPAIVLLGFMVPLPYQVETRNQLELRILATKVSTYVMQTFGVPAAAEGTVIRIGQRTVGVADACSGLAMFMVFVALSTTLAMIVKRPWWERLIIGFSSIPIALISNMFRIVMTVMFLHYNPGASEETDKFIHDLAGWLMMPIGLGLLGLELWILNCMFLEVDEDDYDPNLSSGQGMMMLSPNKG